MTIQEATSEPLAVRTRGLRKSFAVGPDQLAAVAGVDLAIGVGEIFGMLGPNGAGKTTTLRMLTTLLPIDSGEAEVAGVDVRRHPSEVRRRIGYVGQAGGADLPATGRENLVLQGRLYGAPAREARRRAEELISLFDLERLADRAARTYSGGQRRRLEVALGIVHRPQVLFLDEPSVGLDPQNRRNLWEHLVKLRQSGSTVVLTTHYLEEADALAGRVAIIDRGRVVAEGAPAELKRQFSADLITVRVREQGPRLERLRRQLATEPSVSEARIEGETLRVHTADVAAVVARLLERFRGEGAGLESITVSPPSLDYVFLQRTGRSLRDRSAGPGSVGEPA